jgi:UDP-N-acetylmuramyl pentapeptide synthase
MPCLIELGEKSSYIHEKIGKKIASVCDLAIITSKDKFKELKNGAMEAGMLEKDIILCDNAQEIYLTITSFCKSGDAVLLEGRVPKGLINLLQE